MEGGEGVCWMFSLHFINASLTSSPPFLLHPAEAGDSGTKANEISDESKYQLTESHHVNI